MGEGRAQSEAFQLYPVDKPNDPDTSLRRNDAGRFLKEFAQLRYKMQKKETYQ
jgi:hypothetical protein